MKTSDDLFQLIKSMTKGEIRFFKLSRKYNSEKKNASLQLFEAIEKLEDYDEALLKETFEGEKWLKYWAVEKHTLYKLLLNSLSNYQTYLHRNDPREIDMLQQIRMLQAKSLPHQCAKIVNKLRKKAFAKESAIYHYLANAWDRDLTHNTYELLTLKRMNFIIDEQKEVIERLYNSVLYQNLCDKFYYNYLDNPNPPSDEELELFMANPLLQDESLAVGATSKFMYYSIFSYYYEYINDHRESYQNVLDTLKLLEDNPNFRKRCMLNYFLLKGRELFVTLLTDPSLFAQKLAAYENLRKDFAFEYEAMQGLRDIHLYQIIYCNTANCCSKLDATQIQAQDLIVRQHQTTLETMNFGFVLVELYHYLAKAFYELDLLEKAQYWCDRIEENTDKEEGKNTRQTIASKLLHLFLLAKLEEYTYLKNKISTLKRYLKRVGALDAYHLNLLKLLRSVLGQPKTKNTDKTIAKKLPALKEMQAEKQFDEVFLFDPLLELCSEGKISR